MASTVLQPPNCTQSMTVLDKLKFNKNIDVPVLEVKGSVVGFISAILKPYLLKVDKFKAVQPHECKNDEKIIFFNPDLIKNIDSFPENVREYLEKAQVDSPLYHRTVLLTYNNWKAHEVISAILPPPLLFSGFSTIGHIVHLNLKDELLPYKHIIGEVLLDKINNCQTVVNKTKIIDNVYRNFEMEILAGKDNLKTETKENGCRFELDFAEVYWNPRLNEEHGRIIDILQEGDVLYDIFCGIGPFAIPAAKKNCEVLANDMNSACCRWLERNKVINKITNNLTIFNKPGDVFIKEDLRNDYLRRIYDTKYKNSKYHITMNLPSTSHTILPALLRLFQSDELSAVLKESLPIVHFYCFIHSKEETETKARELVEQTLYTNIADEVLEICNVRNVAPNKKMVRVSFHLSKAVLVGNGTEPIIKEKIESSNMSKYDSEVEMHGLKQKLFHNVENDSTSKKFKSD